MSRPGLAPHSTGAAAPPPPEGRAAGPPPGASTPASSRTLRRRPGFWTGVLAGMLLLVFGRFVINATLLPDLIVSPLLVEDTPGRGDAIVVLGAGLREGCQPNNNAIHRVLRAAQVWHEGRAPVMIITGAASGGGPCTVADVMARLARDLGVPAGAIRVERRSSSTRENGVLTARILHALQARHVVLVTDRLHMRRAAGVFAALGFTSEIAAVPVQAGHADNVSMLAAGFREFAALGYYGARGWLHDDTDGTAGAQDRDAGPQDSVTSPPPAPVTTTYRHPDGPIVLLGASYAAGLTLDPIAGHEVLTKGVPGQESRELLARFERDVVAANPRAVVIWGYINDIFRADPARVQEARTRARENVTRMIELSRSHGIEPILTTELTIRPPDSWTDYLASWVGWALGKRSHQDYINGHVLELNGWVRGLAAREGLLLLDLHRVLSGADNVRLAPYATPDGSHITPEGYAALRAYVVPALERHFTR